MSSIISQIIRMSAKKDSSISKYVPKNRKSIMTRISALKKDKKGEFYVAEADIYWGVFGSESGFCYELVDSSLKKKAIKIADNMNKANKIKS